MANAARKEKFGQKSSPAAPANTSERRLTAPFVKYINYKPTETDKELFREWIAAVDLQGILDRAGENGYKLGVGFDETTNAYNATLSSRNPKLANAGYVLSVRAPEMSKALQRLLFVHTAIAGNEWERLLGEDEDDW